MPTGPINVLIFTKIFVAFPNLRCLKFNPSSSLHDALLLRLTRATGIYPTSIYSTLIELHVSLSIIEDFIYLLDGPFDQLRILYVTYYINSTWPSKFEHNNVGYFY